jgi:hypothetical protein
VGILGASSDRKVTEASQVSTHSHNYRATGDRYAAFKKSNQFIHGSTSMATRRSNHVADRGLERLRWRIVDVIDVVCNALASCPRDAAATVTAANCHDGVLLRDNLRNGDDDHHRRRG